MNRRDVFVLAAYAVPTLGLMLQGLVYLTTATFMPYHADALAVRWDDLPANYQGFLLGVIKAMGAGSIGVSLSVIIMVTIPLRAGASWARWAVPTVGVVFTALTAYAAFTIDVRTPASTPWRQTCALSALYLAGGVASCWPRRSAAPPEPNP